MNYLSGLRGRYGEFVYVIAWGRGQLRINFTCIFKVFTKLSESPSDEGNFEAFENSQLKDKILHKGQLSRSRSFRSVNRFAGCHKRTGKQ